MHSKLGGCTVFVSQEVATIVIDEVLAKSRVVANKKFADAQMMVFEEVQSNNGLISWNARVRGCYLANVQFVFQTKILPK